MKTLKEFDESMTKFMSVINKEMLNEKTLKSTDPQCRVAFDKVRESFILMIAEMRYLANIVDAQLKNK